MKVRLKFFLSVFIFLAALFLIGQNLDKPFWGEHDWNGARYGNIARNYLRYGLIHTKLGQVESSGLAKPNEFEYYTHYPPLLPLTIGLSYKIFGIDEWSTRIIPLLATAGSIVLIFFIGLNLYNLKVGLTASLLALATPMTLYFGKNASHEPLTLFFILLSFYGYISIGKRKFAKLLFIVGLILAQVTAWAGYFLIPALTLTHLLRNEFNQIKKLIPFWILSVILFTIHLVHVNILTGSISGGNLFESLLQRSGLLSSAQPQGFNLPNFFNQLRLWFSTLFTITLTIFALLGIKKSWPVISLGIVGVIYVILFSSSVFIHNYLIFYFLPFISIAAVLGIEILTKFNFLKKIYPIWILLIVFAVFGERRGYLNALNESSPDKFAVEIGKEIKNNSEFNDVILIIPQSFSYSADNFLKFYGDRKLIYSDQKNLKSDLILEIDQANGTYAIVKRRNLF